MFHTRCKALGTGLATALIVAATAAPAALAHPADLRSPDARDAGQRTHVVVPAPAWPANPQPVAAPRVVASAPSSDFDWGSAGIGAAAGLGAFAIALVGVAGLRRRVGRPAEEL
jgi:hypothetical protein